MPVAIVLGAKSAYLMFIAQISTQLQITISNTFTVITHSLFRHGLVNCELLSFAVKSCNPDFMERQDFFRCHKNVVCRHLAKNGKVGCSCGGTHLTFCS